MIPQDKDLVEAVALSIKIVEDYELPQSNSMQRLNYTAFKRAYNFLNEHGADEDIEESLVKMAHTISNECSNG